MINSGKQAGAELCQAHISLDRFGGFWSCKCCQSKNYDKCTPTYHKYKLLRTYINTALVIQKLVYQFNIYKLLIPNCTHKLS